MLNSLLESETCYSLNDTLTRSEIWFAECKELHVKLGFSALIKL